MDIFTSVFFISLLRIVFFSLMGEFNLNLVVCVYSIIQRVILIQSNCPTNFFLFLQGSPVNITVGSHVWVEDPALAWVDGQVSQIDGQDVHVKTRNGKRVYTQSFSLAY